jgi:hypothetical protein
MILFIYMIFRLLLLFLFDIGTQSQYLYAQDTSRRIPPPDSTATNERLVERVLDSTMRSVQELKDIPKLIDKGTRRDKALSKKLDVIYYESILPLKALEPRHTYSAYNIPVRAKELPAIRQVTFLNNELCIDSLPYRVTPEAALSRHKVRFFQKIKNWFK